MYILKEKHGLAIKEFELGDKSKYWDHTTLSIQNNKLAEYLKVSNSALCRWFHKWKSNKPADSNTTNKPTHTNTFNYHATTKTQRECAIRHFNMFENSRHWDSNHHCLNLQSLRDECKVSDWTIRYWYAVWKLDHNTTLDFKPSSGEDSLYNKQQYFNELKNKTGINTFDAMAKYNIGSSVLKKWNLEFKTSNNKALLSDPIIVTKDQVKMLSGTVVKTENKIKPAEHKEQPVANSNPIDTIESFFSSFAEFINKSKQTELELNTYKQRCEKWAKQIVALQNALIKKD